MKIIIEVSNEDFLAAMRLGWNERFGMQLVDNDFVLPDIGEVTNSTQTEQIKMALHFLQPHGDVTKIERIE